MARASSSSSSSLLQGLEGSKPARSAAVTPASVVWLKETVSLRKSAGTVTAGPEDLRAVG
jgi:hypothetical protein